MTASAQAPLPAPLKADPPIQERGLGTTAFLRNSAISNEEDETAGAV